jgi:KDO2-lipid IV(A) lauroyltransferase
MSLAGIATRTVATLVPRLSFALASGLGRSLGSVAWALDGRHREVAINNLAIAFPGMSEARRKQLAQAAFQQAGRTAIEMLWSPSLDDATLAEVAVFEGKHHLDEALAEGNGALITTAHFGNWELMGVALAHVGVPMNVIARQVDDPQVEAVLHRLRTRTGARVIHKQDAVRAALRTLRAGEVVGILIDQNTLASEAAFVPFFGKMAATTRITAQLHVRTGAPIIMLFCIPEGDRYRFVLEPFEAGSGVAGDEDVVERLTAATTRQIEGHIRRCPEAWLWIHDRWRTREPTAVEAATE